MALKLDSGMSLDQKREAWKNRAKLFETFKAGPMATLYSDGLTSPEALFADEDIRFFEEEEKMSSLETELKKRPGDDEMRRAQLAAVWQSRAAARASAGGMGARPMIATSPLGMSGAFMGLRAMGGGR
jgi:phage terminase large subunit-like protein